MSSAWEASETVAALCARGHWLDAAGAWVVVGGISRCRVCYEGGVAPGAWRASLPPLTERIVRMRRGSGPEPGSAGPDLCSKGHYDWSAPGKNGRRRCARCARDAAHERHLRRKAARL